MAPLGYSDRASYRDQSRDYSRQVFKTQQAAKDKIGSRCEAGHPIVGYRGKGNGILRSYCVVGEGSFLSAAPGKENDGKRIAKVKLQFCDHSNDGFWVAESSVDRGEQVEGEITETGEVQ